jgi:pimeloyl-ACP methyl ester carboxylesterase
MCRLFRHSKIQGLREQSKKRLIVNQTLLLEPEAQELFTMDIIDHRGLRIEHYIPKTQISSTPIVVEPGICSLNFTQRRPAEKLAACGHEVFVMTLRGHGESKTVPDFGKITVDEHIDDLDGFISSFRYDVNLIGHSMGALIGANVARRNFRVGAFVSMMSAPPQGMFMGWECIKRTPKYLQAMRKGRQFFINATDSRAIFFNLLDDTEFVEAMSGLGPESGTAAWEIVCWKHSMPRLTCPSLVIAGKYDKITPHQEGIRYRLGSKDPVITIPTSHMFMCDKGGVETAIRVIHPWLEARSTFNH